MKVGFFLTRLIWMHQVMEHSISVAAVFCGSCSQSLLPFVLLLILRPVLEWLVDIHMHTLIFIKMSVVKELKRDYNLIAIALFFFELYLIVLFSSSLDTSLGILVLPMIASNYMYVSTIFRFSCFQLSGFRNWWKDYPNM